MVPEGRAGVKGVFDIRGESGYDDRIAERYHIPPDYRRAAAELVGGWIVYRESRRNGGRQAYVAVARLSRIVPDEAKAGHAFALVDGFLAFDRPVPLARDGRYAEAPLREVAPAVGAWLRGRSVRPLADADFAAIVRSGLALTLDPANAARLGLEGDRLDLGTAELLAAPAVEQERRIEQVLLNRKIRDASFRRQVCEAYDHTCAVTRLRIVNGGGRAEVQAAHIWPVGDGGPDEVRNGVALSGTAHWLFDRHLISLTDDYRLLVSHNKVPAEYRQLFARQLDRVHLPADPSLRPHPAYLARHREAFSGGMASEA